MTDNVQQQQSSQPEDDSTPQPPTEQSDASGEDTPEAIEQFWRNRQSQSDKAHAAEAKALRERIEQLEKGATPDPSGSARGTQSEDSSALIEQLKGQLAEEKQLRVTDTRTAKYPHAASALDPVVLSQMDEGKLANLNERLAPPSGPGVDRNNPARKAAGEKPLSEMTTQELKDRLKTLPVPGQQPS